MMEGTGPFFGSLRDLPTASLELASILDCTTAVTVMVGEGVETSQERLRMLSQAASVLAEDAELLGKLHAAVLSGNPSEALAEIPIPDELRSSGACFEVFTQAFAWLMVPARVCRLKHNGQVLSFEYLPPLDPGLFYDEPLKPPKNLEGLAPIWDAAIKALEAAELVVCTEELWPARKEIVTAPAEICRPDFGRPPIDPWMWALE